MEKEKQLLLLCRRLIERSLDWGDSAIWGNDDFEQLSEKIFEKTRVQLSVSTLKRIWGKVKYENFPTAATLNALACSLDYESWRDFRQKNQDLPQAAPAPISVDAVSDGNKQVTEIKQPQVKVWAIALCAIVILASIIIFFTGFGHKADVDASKIKFEAIKVSDNLPNSVIFNYDVSAFKSGNVFIQQSWDDTRRDKVPGDGKQFTSIYYEPGFFISKLIVDNEVKKQRLVFIKTKGWLGLVEKSPVPAYLSDKETKGNSYMGISDSTLRQKTGSPVFNDTWVKFSNVKEFKDIDAGNFTFETNLRNASAIEASVCRQIKVVLLGTNSAIIIPLGAKGCVSSLDLLTGEIWISGKNHDMRGFGCDFSQFQDLKCTVENHRFKIFLNNKQVINTTQNHSLGEIVGIRFECEGALQVKDVKLATPGRGSYNDHF